MLLAEVAAASDAVAATSSRLEKTALIADLLGRADAHDVGLVVRYLTGELRQRRTGVGVAALRALPPPAATASLTVSYVDAVFADLATMSGRGSTAARRDAFAALMATATAPEQQLLAGLVSGQLRQGAAAGVMTEAVARGGGVAGADVRSALTLSGSLPDVATALRRAGRAGLAEFSLQVGTPLAPMLASSAPSVGDAVERAGGGVVGVEWKLDGIRVQLHRDGSDVAVFSRSGDDLTAAVPDVVEQVAALPTDRVVLDAEAIVLRPDGRPAPFQVTGSRVGRRDVARAREQAPLTLVVFDAMHMRGVDLLGEPAAQRWAALEDVVAAKHLVPRLVTDSASQAEPFVADALARGHEGVVVKAADGTYAAGRRGASWVKVKPRVVLDLVVVAVEWGHGRRTGRLSNLHLAAYDPAGAFGARGGFVMLGKTFKGMTDAMLTWQTERFLSLADGPTDDGVVRVRPEQVVEIAIDGVQRSSRYPGGVALRFARVLRYRPDKAATESDTIESVRQLMV
ncbi:MAG: ATP-dependent DNA ligase [Jiangellales bacterium]